MKRNLLLLALIVALVFAHPWESFAKDKVAGHPWEEKLFTDIVSVFVDEELTSEEKTDKIMGLASHTEIESMMFYMLDRLIKSPNAPDECITCLKRCNRTYCSCVSGCDILNDDCWNECLAKFVACMIGCGACQWGAMY